MRLGSIVTQPSARMLRYGRDIQIGWTSEESITGPKPANYEMVYANVPYGRDVYIYGYRISAGESNAFYIVWENNGYVQYHLIDFPSDGTVVYTDTVPINEGYPANRRQGSTISKVSIYSFNPMGTGVIYSAGLLVGGVEEGS